MRSLRGKRSAAKQPWKRRIDKALPAWMLAPTAVLLFGLFIFPLLWSLGLSFYRYSALRPQQAPRFVGFENYAWLLTDSSAWSRFIATGVLTAGSVGLQFLIGVSLAFLLYRDFKGRKIFLSILIAPMMMAPVAAGAFFKLIYDPSFGVLTYLTKTLFGVQVGWLEKPAPAMLGVIIADTWMWSPFVMLLTLSGLLSAPKHLLEMAQIDRAGRRLTFKYILLPHIKPLMMLAVLLRTMESFKLFDTIWIMTQGGPGDSTETLALALYRVGFQYYDTGRASALAYLMLAVVIVLSNFYLRLASRASSAPEENT